MAPRAKKKKNSRASLLRPRRGQIYRVGRRRVRIVGVEGFDRHGEFKWKQFAAVTWIYVSKSGRKRYGVIERDGWTIRMTVTKDGKTETRTGRTFLVLDAGAWRMPPHYELEGK